MTTFGWRIRAARWASSRNMVTNSGCLANCSKSFLTATTRRDRRDRDDTQGTRWPSLRTRARRRRRTHRPTPVDSPRCQLSRVMTARAAVFPGRAPATAPGRAHPKCRRAWGMKARAFVSAGLALVAFGAAACGSAGSGTQFGPGDGGGDVTIPEAGLLNTGDGADITCNPLTCAKLGYTCGKTGDGCGGMIDCGSCTAPATSAVAAVQRLRRCGAVRLEDVRGSARTAAPRGTGAETCSSAGLAPRPTCCGGGGKPSNCGTNGAPHPDGGLTAARVCRRRAPGRASVRPRGGRLRQPPLLRSSRVSGQASGGGGVNGVRETRGLRPRDVREPRRDVRRDGRRLRRLHPELRDLHRARHLRRRGHAEPVRQLVVHEPLPRPVGVRRLGDDAHREGRRRDSPCVWQPRPDPERPRVRPERHPCHVHQGRRVCRVRRGRDGEPARARRPTTSATSRSRTCRCRRAARYPSSSSSVGGGASSGSET